MIKSLLLDDDVKEVFKNNAEMAVYLRKQAEYVQKYFFPGVSIDELLKRIEAETKKKEA